MKGAWHLAWRHACHQWQQSLLLAACVGLIALLPVAVEALVTGFSARLTARARATPMVVGAKGSRFDLVLNALYFRGRVPDPVPLAELERLADGARGWPVPVLARDTAEGFPLVGTTLDYFERRELEIAAGDLPRELGECVLGADVAAELAATRGVGVGGAILSDRDGFLAIEAGYPLKMRVVGRLAPSDGPEDGAVFASLETVWIAEGIGHGHSPPAEQNVDAVLDDRDGHVVLDASVREFQEITPDNVDSFHFHESPQDLPLTAILLWPVDDRAATILRARYRVAERIQLLEPVDVVDEITAFVLGLKVFFDANVALVAVATAALLGLVVALSIRVRAREFRTLERIGVARRTIVAAVGLEFLTVVALGGGVALASAALLVRILYAQLGWL